MMDGPTWTHFAVFALAHAGALGGWLMRMGRHEAGLKDRLEAVEKRLEKGDKRFDAVMEKLDHVSQQLAELQGYLRGRVDRNDQPV